MLADRAALESALGHRFQRPDLLDRALIHASADAQGGYERLEFLGDRVLALVVATMLYESYPHEPEGALARRHAVLVKRDTIARVARAIGLGDHLILAKGEDDSGGRANPTTLGDAFEAVLGALYLDGGLAVADPFIRRHWTGLMGEDLAPPKDFKTRLQEWSQGRGIGLPRYDVVEQSGPPHDPQFVVEVHLPGQPLARGTGNTKRVAEQAAAQALMESVGD